MYTSKKTYYSYNIDTLYHTAFGLFIADTVLTKLSGHGRLRRRRVIRSSPTKKDPLTPLPAFHTEQEEQGLDEDNTPLPGDTGVFEDDVVDNGDIQNRESKDKPSHDTEEQEPVTPDVLRPLHREILGLGAAPRVRWRWVHVEEAAAQVHHFPGEQQREPGHADEGCCAGAVHRRAFGRVVAVAAPGEVAVAPAEEN